MAVSSGRDASGVRAELERLGKELTDGRARLENLNQRIARLGQVRCPHCGHEAFRMIQGAVDGAQCLSCEKTFSMARDTSN
jgi:hypothetical protein